MMSIRDVNGRAAQRYAPRERMLKTVGYLMLHFAAVPAIVCAYLFLAVSHIVPAPALGFVLIGGTVYVLRCDFYHKALEVWTHNSREDMLALYEKTGDALPMLSQ